MSTNKASVLMRYRFEMEFSYVFNNLATEMVEYEDLSSLRHLFRTITTINHGLIHRSRALGAI